jgi:hypothetical protein
MMTRRHTFSFSVLNHNFRRVTSHGDTVLLRGNILGPYKYRRPTEDLPVAGSLALLLVARAKRDVLPYVLHPESWRDDELEEDDRSAVKDADGNLLLPRVFQRERNTSKGEAE